MGKKVGTGAHMPYKKAFKIISMYQPTKHVCRPLGTIQPKSCKFGVAVGIP